MESWVVRFGLLLFVVGFACIVSAMAFGVQPRSRLVVWFRGVMQRRNDYTGVGWRIYQGGVALSVIGIIAMVLGLM